MILLEEIMLMLVMETVTYKKNNDGRKNRLENVSIHNIVLVHHHLVDKNLNNLLFIILSISSPAPPSLDQDDEQENCKYLLPVLPHS